MEYAIDVFFRFTLRTCCWLLIALGGSTVWAADAEQAPHAADLVFHHGAVYTVDAVRSWAEAVAVQRGRIVYVGPDAGARDWVGPQTLVVDLNGKMLLPGFHDCHVHLVEGGVQLGECDLTGLTDVDDILEAVRRYAEQHPEEEWVRGGGWQLASFPSGNPHKSLLDRVVPDRPVFLEASDGHSAWVNTKGLQLSGVAVATRDPPKGRIERDPLTGEPTGTLRETAVRLVSRYLPKTSLEEYVVGLRLGVEMANRFGITSVQEASVQETYLSAYAELDRRDELSLRATAAIKVDPAAGVHQLPRMIAMRSKYMRPRLRPIAAKIYADGVLETRTAAVLEPYVGFGNDRGRARVEPDVLNPVAALLDREGFQIHIHAIGDRAIRNALDALEFAQHQNGVRDSRHHIAHLELIHPHDMPRFRRLGVIANFQPFWAFADPSIVELTIPILGPERSRWLYPIHSVAQTGAVIACGSDWSVTTMNPLDAIQVAVTRGGLDKDAEAVLLPEEAVDLSTMIAAYTINGAYVLFQEKETGSIEVGKAADLIVLNRNLFDLPPRELHEARVVLTLLEGEIVYRDPEFSLEDSVNQPSE